METLRANKKRFGSDWQTLIIFLVAGALLLTLWFREGDTGPLHSIRGVFTGVSKPLSQVGASANESLNTLGNTVSNVVASDATMSELIAQNNELTAQVAQLEELRLEGERLAALLEIKNAYNMVGTGARVIGHDTDTWNQVITIDKGSADGITVGMPVMNAGGLLGQVETVTSSSSTVRLISDEQSGVAAMIQSTRVEGILSGSASGTLLLEFIPSSETVEIGDIVLTSGIGGIYPRGIILGEVTSVTGEHGDLYKTIIVTPTASSGAFEEVFVLTGEQKEVTYTAPQPAQTGNTAGDTSNTTGDTSNAAGNTSNTSGDTSNSAGGE